ncbi:MAG TPA: CBS domain-containing protein [Sphingomonas sp.]|jgi:CBS domain-containing protein|nr:CBS domain-containing protein [Sphingomonas sp.]
MIVADILERKGGEVVAVGAETPLAIAIGTMNGAAIGALVVEDAAGLLAGLLSEREVVAALVRRGAAALSRPVREAMIAEPPTVTPQDDLRRTMAIMTDRRARHLPVVKSGRAIGLVSLGDVVKWRLGEKELENAVLLDMARWRSVA